MTTDFKGVLLAPLSPLTERSKLCHSPAIDTVTDALGRFGFACTWDNGLTVSPTAASKLPADMPALTIDTFMGGLTRERKPMPGTYRPKVSSSVAFLKAGSLNTRKVESAPSSPKASALITAQPAASRPGTPQQLQQSAAQPSTRFSRLAQSVDSLQQLQVPTGGNINTTNLMSLHRPATATGTSSCQHLRRGSAAAAGPITGALPAVDSPHGLPLEDRPGTGQPSPEPWQPPAGAAQQGSSSAGAQQASTGLPADVPAGQPQSRPATACVDVGQQAASALRPSTALGFSTSRLGTPSGRGTRFTPRQAAHAQFKPSRGHTLVVFQHLDKDQNGKVTISELEDICLQLGFSLEQARRMFDRMDIEGKGFLRPADWGRLEVSRVVQLFSLLYMQKFMGLPGPTAQPEQIHRYWKEQELRAVKSVAAAVHLVRTNALMRGARSASSSGNVIFEAFRFMDTDGSGKLTFDELRDGFYALGVYVKDEVLTQIVTSFDQDGDGEVHFLEFCQKLFPQAARAIR